MLTSFLLQADNKQLPDANLLTIVKIKVQFATYCIHEPQGKLSIISILEGQAHRATAVVSTLMCKLL